MAVGTTIYETLIRLDSDYVLQPALAREWTSNADATRFTFSLQEGVKWHDGQQFSSADVKFTLEKFLPLSPVATGYARSIGSVSTPDERTVVINLTTPYAPLISALASVWIMPQHVFDNGQDLATHPANSRPMGTGPFRFDSFDASQRAVVVRNTEYWGTHPARIGSSSR